MLPVTSEAHGGHRHASITFCELKIVPWWGKGKGFLMEPPFGKVDQRHFIGSGHFFFFSNEFICLQQKISGIRNLTLNLVTEAHFRCPTLKISFNLSSIHYMKNLLSPDIKKTLDMCGFALLFYDCQALILKAQSNSTSKEVSTVRCLLNWTVSHKSCYTDVIFSTYNSRRQEWQTRDLRPRLLEYACVFRVCKSENSRPAMLLAIKHALLWHRQCFEGGPCMRGKRGKEDRGTDLG